MITELIIILFFPLIAIIGGYNLLQIRRANKLRVRDPIRKSNYIKDYLVKEVKDKKTGIVYWQSLWWQKSFKTEKPPESAVDVGNGKLFAECYYISEGQLLWIGDKGISIREEKTKEGKKVAKFIVDNDTAETIDRFKPLTQTQRETVFNQYEKAELIGGKSWTADKIIMAGGLGFLMMFLVIGVIFAPDILEAYTLSKKVNVEVAEQYLEITEAQSNIVGMLQGKINDYEITITQDVGAKSGGGGIVTNDSTPPSVK